MSAGKVQEIAIIGGGSAGWMTASYLTKSLPKINVTLIESSDIPVIGVGEATIFALNQFLQFLGLKEEEWMPACKAAYKYAIRFDNWYELGDSYWHPFEILPTYKSDLHLAHYWHYLNSTGQTPKPRSCLYSDCFLGVDLINKNKVFRQPGAPDHAPDSCSFNVDDGRHVQYLSYAFHFDAGLFAEYLKNAVAIPAGVAHIIDEVTSVHLTEDGSIAYLETKGGQNMHADLFVDCTGFSAQLMDRTLHEPFDSYSDVLFCDRAIAIQVPYQDRCRELRPYTTATALSSGWVWNTPLNHRMGTGYVYSSAFKSGEEAELEYRQHLGEDRVKDLTARHIDMRVGKHRRTWVKNCVAIGLSAGFVEPLESTGIHFIHHGVGTLADALQGNSYSVRDVETYNRGVTGQMEDTRDFLTLHYALTSREDSEFWKQVKYNTRLCGVIPDLLERSFLQFPTEEVGPLFTPSSWTCVLNGMNHVPKTGSQVMDPQVIATQTSLLAGLQTAKKKFGNILWNHADYLDQLST